LIVGVSEQSKTDFKMVLKQVSSFVLSYMIFEGRIIKSVIIH